MDILVKEDLISAILADKAEVAMKEVLFHEKKMLDATLIIDSFTSCLFVLCIFVGRRLNKRSLSVSLLSERKFVILVFNSQIAFFGITAVCNSLYQPKYSPFDASQLPPRRGLYFFQKL